MNFCSQLNGSNGSISAINDSKPCDYDDTTESLSFCWDGTCLPKQNGKQRYCRAYDYASGTWATANEGEICTGNSFCKS